MLQWDSDDESVGDMTRVSDALEEVVANYDQKHARNYGNIVGDDSNYARDDSHARDDSDDDIDEMELLQLRSLVQQIKLQTVIGDNFKPVQYQGSSSVSQEMVEDSYRQLLVDHSLVLEEREQLEVKLKQLLGKDGDNFQERIIKAEKERDLARRETQAVKLEVENLKISHRNLQQFYQDQGNQLGTVKILKSCEVKIMKPRMNGVGATVPVEDYNRLKELHRALSWQLEDSQQMATQQQEELTQVINRAKTAEQEIRNHKFSRKPVQADNSRAPSSQDDGKGRGGGGVANFGGGSYEIEMTIPGQKVPLVIGKGGEIIKRLMEETGAKVWIVQEDATMGNQKCLNIRGTKENAELAEARVNEILESKQSFVKKPWRDNNYKTNTARN